MRRHPRQSGVTPKAGSAPDSLSLLRAYDIDSNPSRPIRSSPLTASTIQGLPLELIDRLRSFPLFASAPDSFLGAIGKYLRPQLHQPHDAILSEGDDARSMYWLVRGSVRVTSRDGESTYAELKPGAFFGEIGILMDIPRTATITASMRSLVVRLNKEDLQKELPNYPQVERAIREEAAERLAILERKKKEGSSSVVNTSTGYRKRSRDYLAGDVEMGEAGDLTEGGILNAKKRKSPSPSLAEAVASSVFGKSPTTIRQILKELPLFAGLPAEILHFLGVNAQPCSFAPFTEIVKQGSQGREVFFVVHGEVEVVTDPQGQDESMSGNEEIERSTTPIQQIRARLKPGQYFGEVTSLSLSPTRTATVRSVNQVECLRITGEVLDDLWRKCSPGLRQQVETEAKRRLENRQEMIMNLDGAADSRSSSHDRAAQRKFTPTVTFSDVGFGGPATEVMSVSEPLDPDPFFSADLENMRARSRRSSLAPPTIDTSQASVRDASSRQSSPPTPRTQSASPLGPPTQPASPLGTKGATLSVPSSPSSPAQPKNPISLRRQASEAGRGALPDSLLVLVLQYLDVIELMRMRQVSMHWHKLVSGSEDLLQDLDLSRCNRRITDHALVNYICPFVGSRPRRVNLNNCFHVTDEGFAALATACGERAKSWKMRSVWDVTGQCILDLVNKATSLEDIDLSNCRKVGDNLLARIVGWTAPPNGGADGDKQVANGSSKLKRLTLSYCKHVQDRSMAHIAQHAASRLEAIDLTRCTSVTDQGFHQWSMHSFPVLKRLVLADCTYLTDQSIVGVANAARNLRELDLSFCCALSDTATEVLALGLTQLTHLDLAFCGSAVSDSSLRCIGLHLLELKFLSVRGCVRVTAQGVESVVEGCRALEVFDVSQCKNLAPWVAAGGIQAARQRGCKTRFETVADGSWRAVE